MRAQLAKQSDTWTKLNQFRVGRSFAHSLERHRVAATAWWASTFLFTELITAQLEQSTDVRQSRIEKKEKPLAFPERGPDRLSLRCLPNCVRATANAADRRGSRGNRRWTADLLLWQRRRDHNGRPLLSSTYATTRTYQWPSPITDHRSLITMAGDELLVARIVDHCRGDVLIHEEEERESEPQPHGAQDGHERQLVHRRNGERWFFLVVIEYFAFDVPKYVRADEGEQHHGDRQRVVGQDFSLPRLQVRSESAITNCINFFTTSPRPHGPHGPHSKRLRFIEIVERDSDPDGAEHEQEEEQRRGRLAVEDLRLQKRIFDQRLVQRRVIARVVVQSEICVHLRPIYLTYSTTGHKSLALWNHGLILQLDEYRIALYYLAG